MNIPGREVVIRAPVAGFVRTASNAAPIELGRSVSTDQTLASLEPFLSPQEQAQWVAQKQETETAIRQSKVAMEFAEAQFDRLKNAPGAVAGSKLLEVQENLQRARIAYEEAQKKAPFLPQVPAEAPLQGKPLPLTAPITGRVTAVHVAPRQFVAAQDPLWTIADWSTLWVRVPVFVGDLERIDARQAAEVQVPGSLSTRRAAPVTAPQPTPTAQQTVDLFFQVENGSGRLRPGQAVGVTIPLGKEAKPVAVPRSAVIWDGSGDSWVYVRTAPELFVRRRIEPGVRQGDWIAVERGLEAGEAVVAIGAEALRGEEFKGQLPGEEED